ncbi:MAG: heavy-metal-associated domain-containing protein [Propionibacteriales bacterium]|nr:heavy-metal-associated domain-containing protein [Propionibacteriales bacterium]
MTTTDYTVSGMTCDHCVSAVTDEVSALPEVDQVTVELANGQMSVTSSGPIALSTIASAVDEAGDYTVVER